jgi:hypothetical protein
MAAFKMIPDNNDESEHARSSYGLLGPHAIDQLIRQAIGLCWQLLPANARTPVHVSKQIRRVVDRALANLEEDAKEFGGDGS